LNICFSANIELKLSHTVFEKALVLNEETYITANNEKLSFSRLKYYLGNIVINYSDGGKYADSIRYHLVDFDNPETFVLELNNVPEGTIKNIEFSIGVDSLTNSNGFMDGDLDPLKGMYWAWSSGFINFKLEGSCLNCASEKEFTYHIGGFIAPYQSFQTVTVPVIRKITADDMVLDIEVNVGNLFIENKVSEMQNIMSPSEKSKNFAMKLPQIFSIKK
jgi:hypothetical protein